MIDARSVERNDSVRLAWHFPALWHARAGPWPPTTSVQPPVDAMCQRQDAAVDEGRPGPSSLMSGMGTDPLSRKVRLREARPPLLGIQWPLTQCWTWHEWTRPWSCNFGTSMRRNSILTEQWSFAHWQGLPNCRSRTSLTPYCLVALLGAAGGSTSNMKASRNLRSCMSVPDTNIVSRSLVEPCLI
jgi:hypothetical protein